MGRVNGVLFGLCGEMGSQSMELGHIILQRLRGCLKLHNNLSQIAMSYQTTESKKQQFRKYLQKTGVIDHLTRALVGLYEQSDKPTNSLEYLKKNLGTPVELDVVKLKVQLQKVKDENIKFRKELEQRRRELQNLKQEDGQE